MQWLAEKLDVCWPTQPLDVVWEYREGKTTILLDENRYNLLQRFPDSESFWREQADVADRLWAVSERLLSLYQRGRAQQIASLLRLLPAKLLTANILKLSTMSAERWLQKHKLYRDTDFCRFIDAQLLISAQTTSSSCNALYAAMFRDSVPISIFVWQGLPLPIAVSPDDILVWSGAIARTAYCHQSRITSG